MTTKWNNTHIPMVYFLMFNLKLEKLDHLSLGKWKFNSSCIFSFSVNPSLTSSLSDHPNDRPQWQVINELFSEDF